MSLTDVIITDEDNFGSISIKILGSAIGSSSSAKDVPCLVDPPDHNWYKSGIYMKCSKCEMSYESKPEKDFIL